MKCVHRKPKGTDVEIQYFVQQLNHFLKKQQYDIEDLCKRSKVERLSLQIDQPFIGQLIRFFRMRMLT